MRRTALNSARWIALAVASLALPETQAALEPAEVVLKGGTIVDGTGAPAMRGDVAIKGGRIVAIGKVEIGPNTKVVDATGLVIAPGFIDLHTHSDSPIIIEATRDNRNYQMQGVTTVVTGNCGGGALDAAQYFATIDRHGAGTNVIHLVPQGAVRSAVLGKTEVKADAAAMEKMKGLVEASMKAGAWGMSSGLIYVPSR